MFNSSTVCNYHYNFYSYIKTIIGICYVIKKEMIFLGLPGKALIHKSPMNVFELLFSQEYEARKLCRQENRRYCDPGVLTYQAERIPEQIRLKVSTPTMSVLSE